MRLPYSLAAALCFITCLSAFLLGLGQEDFVLPVLMFIAAAASMYVTDLRRWIQLGDWTVNVLILLILGLTLQDAVLHIFNYQNEDLAVAIARTLVFVEMVLLFREKAPRFCWQILLISLLQVLVASAMQQGLLFGLLLIVYTFACVFAFVLILLLQENRYYRSHSFVDTFVGSLKDEISARQDHGRLVRIALVTLLTGPLSLIFSYSSEKDKKEKNGLNRTGWDLLRSFFAVFPKDDVVGIGRWESVPVAENFTEHNAAIPIPEIQDENPNSGKTRWYEDIWDNAAENPSSGEFEADKYRWASAPNMKAILSSQTASQTSKPSPVKPRFPLLVQRPAFSAGTLQRKVQIGSSTELFRHLAFGTFI
ncbi:MAG: hypothetical protein FWE67_02335, partial [Planctomycetaceae bacterium]|nr:hypothetical protein [Planctomycetaceae bacterium]